MRRAAKVDANQKEIVAVLRSVGAEVALLHAVGAGVPDICVGFRGRNYLLEVKDGSLPPSARRLTVAQEKWHNLWPGQVDIVKDANEALQVIGAVR